LQQVYRREGCEIQGAVLWNMSLRPSYGQEWVGYFHVPSSSRVCTQSEKSMTVYSYFSFFLHINIMNGNWQFMEDA
jgi:hypothetical protein